MITVNGHTPQVHEQAWVAPGAVLAGEVSVGAETGIWYTCVVRADLAPITLGARTNVQDGSVLHADPASRRPSATASPSATAPSCTAARWPTTC